MQPSRQSAGSPAKLTPRVLRTAETIALTNITAHGYIANSTTLLSLPNKADIELLYTRVGSSWTEGRCTLQDIKPHPDGAELLVKQPCWDNQVRTPLFIRHPDA